jgi:hypothetical protein
VGPKVQGERTARPAELLGLRIETWSARQSITYNFGEFLPGIGGGFLGRSSKTSKSEEIEQRYRVDVSMRNSPAVYGMTYTDLFYTPGDSSIRSLTLEGEQSSFIFRVFPKGNAIGVVRDDQSLPLSVKEMAQVVIKRAIERIECHRSCS